MPRIRDQERNLVEKIKRLQGQLQTQFKRVSAFVYQKNTGIEIQGTASVVDYLKGLESDGQTLSSICEEAALREALADIQAERSQDNLHCPGQKKKLVVPLSCASYDEMKAWLVEDLKAEAQKKDFVSSAKNTVYSYDKNSEASTEEHKRRRPDQWPEDLMKWNDVSFGISALGSSFSSIPKSAACPRKPLDFFRLFIKGRLQASGLDPEKFFTKSPLSDKRIKNRLKITQTRTIQEEASRTHESHSQRPTPQELAHRTYSESSRISNNSNHNSNSSHNSSHNSNFNMSTGENSPNNNSFSDISLERDLLTCHICQKGIEVEEDPVLCDCATHARDIFVHWLCIREKGCTHVHDVSPQAVGVCHICTEMVSLDDMKVGNILLCHCDTNDNTFVHHTCLQNNSCNE